MPEYIEREAAICIANYAEDEHPYKIPQVPETYSDYNQGWSDACFYIQEKLAEIEAADVEQVRHRKERNMNRDTPIQVTPDKECSVKAFDGVDKVVTYRCAPCPACGKWLAVNPAHNFCEWCGQALRMVDKDNA